MIALTQQARCRAGHAYLALPRRSGQVGNGRHGYRQLGREFLCKPLCLIFVFVVGEYFLRAANRG
jgi:hypothetical protein